MLQLPMALFTSQGEQVLDLAGADQNRKMPWQPWIWKTLRSGFQNIQDHWLFGASWLSWLFMLEDV
jgi:hypothetical protein